MGNRKIEFIAKTLNDIGKAVFVAGLVSNFFPNLPMMFRAIVGILSLIFILTSIFLYPSGDKT